MKHINWNDISELGLLERINKQVMHPLGLAVYRTPVDGMSGGAIISDDGVFEYPPELPPLDVLTEEQIREKVTELTKQAPANASAVLVSAIMSLEQHVAELTHANECLTAERDALAAQVAEMTIYEWREIGGGDWCACDESWFNHCQNDPTLDTRKRIKGVNEIRAEAGKKGYLQALSDAADIAETYGKDYCTTDVEDEAAAEKYAETIRNGGEV